MLHCFTRQNILQQVQGLTLAAFLYGKRYTHFLRKGQAEKLFYAAPLGLWTPSSSISPQAMIIMGSLLLAVIILLLLLHIKKPQKAETLVTSRENPQEIDDILQEAVDSRARIDLVCTRGQVTYRQLQGSCVLPEKRHQVHIALSGGGGDATDWQDAPVDVYFHFTSHGEKTFYHFSTFVQKIHHQGNTVLIVLPRPSMLTNNQRREFLRIIPGVGMVETATAWQHVPGIPLLPAKVQDLGRPHFAFRPPNLLSMEVKDISASGIRLRFSVEQIKKQPAPLAVNSHFCILLIMDAMKNDDAKVQIWLETVCRRWQALPGNTHIDVGLQFTQWYQTESLTTPIEWAPVAQDGEVPVLQRWVSRVNVLLSRLAE